MRAALLFVLALSQLPYARQAFDLGRTHDDALMASFEQSYELTAADPIDRAEIVTEFRRAVSLVRDRANQGDFFMTQQDLAKAMKPFEGQVALVVRVRLHPLHVYAKPPSWDIYVETGNTTKPIAAATIRRDPVYPAGFTEGAAWTMIRLEASFPRAEIEAAAAPALVVTDDQGNVVWKARLDLSRYR